jgi:putative MFS transporter
MNKTYHSPLNIAVIAAGLGFFVDAFDLFLFNVYRVPSLKDLGFSGKDLTSAGETLLSIQMLGMMIGGIVSGMLGDKKGRVAVLFGSILLYSFANIANGFVNDFTSYAVIRFFAGVGLAGELGAGITLVSESMTTESRGYGTILVASLGAAGAVCAGLAGDFLPWRTAFITAGLIGFVLLLLRFKSLETSIFEKSKLEAKKNGSLLMFFSNRSRFLKYLGCIIIGVPIWFSVGILITLTPEIAAGHNLPAVKLTTCFIVFQLGIMFGDLSSGVISQLLKTRKKVLVGFMLLAAIATILHFKAIYNEQSIVITSSLIGFGCGYLSVFVTSTAEQFGTNLRVLATATVTNFMRGAVTILIPLRIWIENEFQLKLTESLMIVGSLVWVAAISAAIILPDTYGKNLDYQEQ